MFVSVSSSRSVPLGESCDKKTVTPVGADTEVAAVPLATGEHLEAVTVESSSSLRRSAETLADLDALANQPATNVQAEVMQAATAEQLEAVESSSSLRGSSSSETLANPEALTKSPVVPIGSPVPEHRREPRSHRPRRRGSGHQYARRRAEQHTRRHTADVGSELVRRGSTWRDVAARFSISARTLRRWRQRHQEDSPTIRILGRPVPRSAREDRNRVIQFLDELGPHVGVATLRRCFPAMSRSELTDLLKRYRRVLRKRHRVPFRVLDWQCPGRVWAIDFSGPLTAVDGRYRYLLAVRDVCTGEQLLWLPVKDANGEVARDALAGLFATHGAPLVLKSDNGSPFTGGEVQELLNQHEVSSLLSPPYWPRYNGAIEAGIGSLKDRTEAAACRAGHAGYWTWDNVAQARLEANTLSRPVLCNYSAPMIARDFQGPVEVVTQTDVLSWSLWKGEARQQK